MASEPNVQLSEPRVTLVNFTPGPVETIFVLWEASKGEAPLLSVAEVKASPELKAKAEALFWKVLVQGIPVGEHLGFIFMLEGVSVSFREQMVRHRIGTVVGDRIGVDIIPDLATSTWWSQSMRIANMGGFADKGMYRIPESLGGKSVHLPIAPGLKNTERVPAGALYRQTMAQIQDAYNALVAAGVPMEDARDLIPLGATHRISWALNTQSLIHILGKRSCWILQASLWAPIIEGMINELSEKVHPLFRRLAAPPCIDDNDCFRECVYRLENQRRLSGDDDHAPCPLYLVRDGDGQTRWESGPGDKPSLLRSGKAPIHKAAELPGRAERYRKLWGHDPYLWEKAK